MVPHQSWWTLRSLRAGMRWWTTLQSHAWSATTPGFSSKRRLVSLLFSGYMVEVPIGICLVIIVLSLSLVIVSGHCLWSLLFSLSFWRTFGCHFLLVATQPSSKLDVWESVKTPLLGQPREDPGTDPVQVTNRVLSLVTSSGERWTASVIETTGLGPPGVYCPPWRRRSNVSSSPRKVSAMQCDALVANVTMCENLLRSCCTCFRFFKYTVVNTSIIQLHFNVEWNIGW